MSDLLFSHDDDDDDDIVGNVTVNGMTSDLEIVDIKLAISKLGQIPEI